MKKFTICDLDGVNWDDHCDDSVNFDDLIKLELIAVGNVVTVEGQADCPLPLRKNQFCITFSKDNELLVEEPFSLEECNSLFGSDFNY